MIFVLQPVAVADRCFLCELLYWFALRRLPLAEGHPYEPMVEYRFSDVCELDTTRFVFEQPITYAECELASLPPNPRYQAILENTPRGDHLEQAAEVNIAIYSQIRDYFTNVYHEELPKVQEMIAWDKRFMEFLDYYKSKIYVHLREGVIKSAGVKVKGSSWKDIENSNYLSGHSEIPQTDWFSSKIDWEKSVLYGSEYSYCWINFDVRQMLSIYPIPELSDTNNVKKMGDNFVLDQPNLEVASHQATRGRPPKPWDSFNVEVAWYIHAKGGLPEKKESVIADFKDWFQKQHGMTVGRSSISQKLTPYYRKFFGP